MQLQLAAGTLRSWACPATCGQQRGTVCKRGRSSAQVAGVLVLDGETLRTLRVMATDNIETPEGIAFTHGCTYIARCLAEMLCRSGGQYACSQVRAPSPLRSQTPAICLAAPPQERHRTWLLQLRLCRAEYLHNSVGTSRRQCGGLHRVPARRTGGGRPAGP